MDYNFFQQKKRFLIKIQRNLFLIPFGDTLPINYDFYRQYKGTISSKSNSVYCLSDVHLKYHIKV